MDTIPHRPTHVNVDLNRLTTNYRAIETAVFPAKVMAVVKANAYGHGMIRVARHMQALGAPYLGVAILEEGVRLRLAGITAPVLVLGGILGDQIPLFLQHKLAITAVSIDRLHEINKIAGEMGTRATVHLKIDTGMGRLGIRHQNADKLLEAALLCEHCHIEGIYTHFATADEADLTFAHEQLRRFNTVLEFYPQRGLPRPPLCHISNSGGILQMKNGRLPNASLDMVRAGILLYGVYPANETARTIAVQPALTWKTKVVYFKVALPDQPISYGSTWKSDHLVRIVTLPVGYGDGYFRAMSNRAEVIIRGQRHPVVGRIAMDQMMVNIEWQTAYNNDEAILIGSSDGVSITVEELADWANTIPYEILTNINTRVPRLYNGELITDGYPLSVTQYQFL